MRKFVQRDCTEGATALFTRFVERHDLRHEISTDAPVEVMWHIPAQKGLSLPITLGLQNWDELNLGVGDFWSYFFPFDDVAEQFELILDKWIAGDARVGITGKEAAFYSFGTVTSGKPFTKRTRCRSSDRNLASSFTTIPATQTPR